jgi:outer membrane biosynthesis protein TonB
MRIILALAFLIAFSASAFAEGNKITVINEDGTKTSIDLGAPSGEQPVESVPMRRAPAPRTVDADTPAPAKQAAEPVKKPAAKPVKKPAAPKAAKKETPVKKDVAAKKKKATKPAKQKAQKKQAAPVASAVAPKNPPAAQSAQRLGPNMTADDAIRIALDVAPPARAFHAYPVNYKGLHVYQVVFTTEDGDRSVFVDRETGKIVR